MYDQTSSFRGYVTDRRRGTNFVGLNYLSLFSYPEIYRVTQKDGILKNPTKIEENQEKNY